MKQFIRIRRDPWLVKAEKEWGKTKKRLRRKEKRSRISLIYQERRSEAFARAAELRKNPTNAELKFLSLLQQNNLHHIFQHVIFLSSYSYRIADFYLPDYLTVIELDGSYHDLPGIKERDRNKDKQTKFKVLRFKNSEIFQPDFFQKFIAQLKKPEKLTAVQPVKRFFRYPTIPKPSYSYPSQLPTNTGKAYTLKEMRDMGAI
jgi:very-short-patch-repair endonuclease